MSEDEAKTKWCPHAVASHTNPRLGFETPEQLGDIPPYDKIFPCIASQCMAWRVVPVKSTNSDGFTIHENGGYCGLAGAPA